jgi:hypothetical protein
MNPQQAAKATAEWLARYQPSILRAVGHGAKAEAEAIVNSGWAESKYGGIDKFWSEVLAIGSQGITGKTTPGTYKAEAQPAPVVVVQQADPKEMSPKIKASGKKLSESGTHLQGHTQALRGLRTRGVKF